MASERWDRLTSRQRCYLLFKKIDINTRALAKLASAIVDQSDEQGKVVHECAPDLLVALRTTARERRNLRAALEVELEAMHREAAAAQAIKVGQS
jgi:hypothetical protein